MHYSKFKLAIIAWLVLAGVSNMAYFADENQNHNNSGRSKKKKEKKKRKNIP